jgi:acyl carrier protein
MVNQVLVAEIDPKLIDEVEEIVRSTATTICAEQPDVPQPDNLRDLDSFSMVQVLLELENSMSMKLLEKMEHFEGESFRDLATFILIVSAENDEEEQQRAAVASAGDPPTPA